VDTAEISYRVADFLKQHAPFQAVEMADLVALAAHGRVRFHEPREYIAWQGEPHRWHLLVIQQGTVSLWQDDGGVAQLRDIRGAGDMIGLERYNGAPSCAYTARSESDVVIYAFPVDDFDGCLMKYPQVAQYVTAEGRSASDYQPGTGRRAAPGTFLHTLGASTRAAATCSLDDSMPKVAAQLLDARGDPIAVVDGNNQPRGAVTTATVLRWVASGGDAHQSIGDADLDPLPEVVPDASVSDAVVAMAAKGAEAVAVTADGRLQRVVSARAIGTFFSENPVRLAQDAARAATLRQLREINGQARAFVLDQLQGPSTVDWLAQLTYFIDRAIVLRILTLTSGEVPGCWCFSGEAGRGELLTRLAPQPVVILADERERGAALAALQRLQEGLVECDYLPEALRAFDPPFYVAPVAEWRRRYRAWIQDPDRQEMYRARTLFDLRAISGSPALWQDVEAEVAAATNPEFVQILANDCLATMPPLTFFQDAVVDRDGEQTTIFRLEESALRPIVDVGRVFGMATGRALGVSTADRLAAARSRLPDHHAVFRDATDTLRVVLWQQARVGITQGTSGAELPPSLLSRYDRRVLKGGFHAILRLIEFCASPVWLEQL
jgi:CBS domain-containing protein